MSRAGFQLQSNTIPFEAGNEMSGVEDKVAPEVRFKPRPPALVLSE
jgi:hypothetical protein